MELFFKGIKISLIRLELFKRKVIMAWYKRRGRFYYRNIHGSIMRLDAYDIGVSSDLIIDRTREDFVAREFRKLQKKWNW